MYVKIKCIISRLIGILGLLILWPLFLLISILVKLDSKGPVFFKQERLGYKGKSFNMYKFRSMCVGAENMGSGVYSDNQDPRVTKVGRILRATSLDELPQLINLANGTMHLISCRPPLIYHPWPLEEYSDEQLHMFDLRPGITGWAQINGRKDVEWNKRIELNCWYVDHLSFFLDIKIFFITIFKVLKNADNENQGKTVFKKEEN
ncbi:sugar transferase [Thomasclavelia sp.]|uniref:sugar transferase n=1 Tax=Thomasclavelia sp. TaxID=3025757 RepID=UPI0025F8E054|nr:sugar transferase [Thomasclavelia sp.]